MTTLTGIVAEERPETAASNDARIQADLGRLLQDRLVHESALGVWVHPILILVIVAIAWDSAPRGLLSGWAAAVIVTAVLRGVWLFIAPRRGLTERSVRNGVRVTVTLLAIAWGVGGALVLPLVPFETTALILVVLAGIIASALTTLAADPLSLRGFLAGIALPVFASLAISDRSHDLAAAIVVAVFTLGMAIVARRAHITLVDHLKVTARLSVSEEAAKRAEAVMRDARDLAERVAQARSAFLANMSHEIRTPMNAVLGFVELILDTELSTEQRRALELVRSSSEALLMILNDILDYSKIEAEHLELESIPFDVAKVVHATASLLAVRAREKHLELLADVAPEVPRAVRGDPTRLRQVLMNLIGNAIKFTEQGEVVVSVTALSRDGMVDLRFGVRDTGIGIAPENLKTVFREFTQADSTMTRRYGGTGLGLAISQRLVRLMGGELGVTSEVGRGSNFSFTLTLPVEASTPERAVGGGLAALGGRRMLIVDDNETNRRILREMLAAEGIKVDEVASATEGLAALGRARYDLAILDVQMPDMDGFQLAAAVRGDRKIARTNLLMLTSAGQRGDGERCRELGIRGYLTKPMSRSDLLEAIGTVLAGSPDEAGTPEVVTRHTIAESRRSLKVLLAEDNPVNQQVAIAMLVKRGHEVHVVGNGREAVDAVAEREYDIVLMDIQMPEMDGFEATKAIRATARGARLPIVAMTAHALSGERERCLSHGMTDYLAKPFKAHELFQLVEQHHEAEATPTPASAAGPARPPVDLDGFRTMLREAGAEEALYSILDTFLRQAPERVATLATAVASGTGIDIAKAAHVFRGAAATIGAGELAGLLEQVETKARAGEVEEAREYFEQASPVAHSVIDYLRQQRAAITAATPGGS